AARLSAKEERHWHGRARGRLSFHHETRRQGLVVCSCWNSRWAIADALRAIRIAHSQPVVRPARESRRHASRALAESASRADGSKLSNRRDDPSAHRALFERANEPLQQLA